MNLAQIELTNLCNLHCPFCFREQMTRPVGNMSHKTFKLALKLCQEMGFKEVWLHNWGEPLMHPNIMEFVKLASHHFTVGFVTNGTLLSEQILTMLRINGLTYLDISLNYDTKNIGNKLFLYYFANQLGIDCRLRCVVNNKREYDRLKSLTEGYKVRWQRAMVHTKKRTKDCLARKKVFVIQWDGTVVPCCHVINKEIVYGNLGEKIIMELNPLKNRYCLKCGEVGGKFPIKEKL